MENESLKTAESHNIDSTRLIVLLIQWRRTLLYASIIAAVISSIVSLIIENKYQSTAIVYAEQQHSFGAQMLEEVQKEDMLTYGEEEDAERLLQIINSSQVRDYIIERYNLWEIYEIDKQSSGANTKINKKYTDNVSAKQTKFGSIQIDALDIDPARARDIVNDIVSYSDTVANKMKTERALIAYNYTVNSLKTLELELAQVKDSMSHLRNLGVYSYEDQIAALTEMYGTAIAEGHPDRAEDLKNQMDRISTYGTMFIKLQTKLKDSYEKYNILRKRNDLLKIDVESQIPVMRVVDYAQAADKKAYPIRWLIVVISVLSTFILVFSVLLIRQNLSGIFASNDAK